ncbi:hypothetical protein J6590_010090 [Homalodisca vitripennis]|nr:hypothetical protein J6590_010090 [Homalodisca vitripennis]
MLLLISPPGSAAVAVPCRVRNNMAAANLLDQNTLEVKTKSIEQTLLPLVKQLLGLEKQLVVDTPLTVCSQEPALQLTPT